MSQEAGLTEAKALPGNATKLALQLLSSLEG